MQTYRSLLLNENVFIWVKKDTGIFYNSQNGRILKFKYNKEIKKFIDQLLNIDNLYCVVINEFEKHNSINNIIKKLITDKYARIVNFTENEYKPISIPPILKIQKTVGSSIKNQALDFGDHIINNLKILEIELSHELFKNKKIFHFLENAKYANLSTLIINTKYITDFITLEYFLSQYCLPTKRIILKSDYSFIEHIDKTELI